MKNSSIIAGTVENVTYYNPTTGYTVIDVDDGANLVTVVGEIGCYNIGECIQVYGEFIEHPTFGRQLKAVSAERSLPQTSASILKYLSSGAIKGVGPSTAKKIVDRFGDDSLIIIEQDPTQLASIQGISLSKASVIADEYRKQFGMREAVVFLSQFNISYDECLKIYKVFGPLTIERIKSNPYYLCSDDIRFSFDRTDEIAVKLGFSNDFVFRVFAGIEYVLKHNSSNGHTCLPKHKHISVCAALLGLEEENISKIINDMIMADKLHRLVINDVEYIMLPQYHKAESYISQRLKSMLMLPPAKIENVEQMIEKIQKSTEFEFESSQKLAIQYAAENGMLALTGGPGTGKTTTLNGIIKLFQLNNIKYVLSAPTGRAAKRMSEITGEDAKTIHRLLEVEWNENGKQVFVKNERNTLDVQAVVVDEFSMVDSLLFESLLRALPIGCRLILVGDSNQLPSIGAGNVLQDLIDSGKIPTVELTEIFRQALSSDIIKNAHQILKGVHVKFDNSETDFYFNYITNPRVVSQTVRDLLIDRVPKKFGYNYLDDVQILAPSRKREAGTQSLNNLLQQAINPPDRHKRELRLMSYVLREGDKIIQTKNNYDLEWEKENGEKGTGVFNGDIGIILKINHTAQIIKIQFEDKFAEYSFEDVDNIELAYAMTVHKSQGSEFKCVIIPICDVPQPLKFRNLLYTAVTRAKELLIIVGDLNELYSMIDNNKKTKRYTALKHFLVSL